uniref:Protein NO VEIN C-terminal domain-containing protein n=1 Tax=Chromera velia CCMP2878 TaxID=1169474 RepID=A0A0G4HMY5_9ALVE|eukprot:Cvel_7533.t1-p1 / transcript=Cvel_7533.t1 / gene=Cvel_7533 / organism=Chromera_velia_CCMP2878 / gene_product=hypothetical protein / transcript_product=hypothetical protein / location=Cvel_scaffold396:27572-36649(+) / protein_length=2851 / sequence_SO=supercontig / SO=protein_coding / is_pseudo=false
METEEDEESVEEYRKDEFEKALEDAWEQTSEEGKEAEEETVRDQCAYQTEKENEKPVEDSLQETGEKRLEGKVGVKQGISSGLPPDSIEAETPGSSLAPLPMSEEILEDEEEELNIGRGEAESVGEEWEGIGRDPEVECWEIVEDIRRELQIYSKTELENLDPSKRQAVERLQESYRSAVGKLATDIYAHDFHFLFELVQNADDNRYDLGVQPTLDIVVSPHALDLLNNELGFREEDVRALCSVGRSTKTQERKEGLHIGRKGIGFKATFAVTSEPHVLSAGFRFRFDAQGPQGSYVLPHWIDREDVPSLPHAECAALCEATSEVENVTRIHLPFSVGKRSALFARSVREVRALPATLLLFLNRLTRIAVHVRELKTSVPDVSVASYTGDRTAREFSTRLMEREDRGEVMVPDDLLVEVEETGGGLATASLISLQEFSTDVQNRSSSQNDSLWLVVRRRLEPPVLHVVENAAAGTAGEGGKKERGPTLLQVAFHLPALVDPQNLNSDCDVPERQPVCAYLPLGRCGLRFVLQADWEVVAARDRVKEDSGWNQWLRERAAELIVSALSLMRLKMAGMSAQKGLDSELPRVPLSFLFHILPLPSEISSDWFVPVAKRLLKLMRRQRCVPTTEGGWELPDRCLWADASLLREVAALFPSGSGGMSLVLPSLVESLERSGRTEALEELIGPPFSEHYVLKLLQNMDASGELETKPARWCQQVLLLLVRLGRSRPQVRSRRESGGAKRDRGKVSVTEVLQSLPLLPLRDGTRAASSSGGLFVEGVTNLQQQGGTTDLEGLDGSPVASGGHQKGGMGGNSSRDSAAAWRSMEGREGLQLCRLEMLLNDLGVRELTDESVTLRLTTVFFPDDHKSGSGNEREKGRAKEEAQLLLSDAPLVIDAFRFLVEQTVRGRGKEKSVRTLLTRLPLPCIVSVPPGGISEDRRLSTLTGRDLPESFSLKFGLSVLACVGGGETTRGSSFNADPPVSASVLMDRLMWNCAVVLVSPTEQPVLFPRLSSAAVSSHIPAASCMGSADLSSLNPLSLDVLGDLGDLPSVPSHTWPWAVVHPALFFLPLAAVEEKEKQMVELQRLAASAQRSKSDEAQHWLDKRLQEEEGERSLSARAQRRTLEAWITALRTAGVSHFFSLRQQTLHIPSYPMDVNCRMLPPEGVALMPFERYAQLWMHQIFCPPTAAAAVEQGEGEENRQIPPPQWPKETVTLEDFVCPPFEKALLQLVPFALSGSSDASSKLLKLLKAFVQAQAEWQRYTPPRRVLGMMGASFAVSEEVAEFQRRQRTASAGMKQEAPQPSPLQSSFMYFAQTWYWIPKADGSGLAPPPFFWLRHDAILRVLPRSVMQPFVLSGEFDGADHATETGLGTQKGLGVSGLRSLSEGARLVRLLDDWSSRPPGTFFASLETMDSFYSLFLHLSEDEKRTATDLLKNLTDTGRPLIWTPPRPSWGMWQTLDRTTEVEGIWWASGRCGVKSWARPVTELPGVATEPQMGFLDAAIPADALYLLLDTVYSKDTCRALGESVSLCSQHPPIEAVVVAMETVRKSPLLRPEEMTKLFLRCCAHLRDSLTEDTNTITLECVRGLVSRRLWPAILPDGTSESVSLSEFTVIDPVSAKDSGLYGDSGGGPKRQVVFLQQEGGVSFPVVLLSSVKAHLETRKRFAPSGVNGDRISPEDELIDVIASLRRILSSAAGESLTVGDSGCEAEIRLVDRLPLSLTDPQRCQRVARVDEARCPSPFASERGALKAFAGCQHLLLSCVCALFRRLSSIRAAKGKGQQPNPYPMHHQKLWGAACALEDFFSSQDGQEGESGVALIFPQLIEGGAECRVGALRVQYAVGGVPFADTVVEVEYNENAHQILWQESQRETQSNRETSTFDDSGDVDDFLKRQLKALLTLQAPGKDFLSPSETHGESSDSLRELQRVVVETVRSLTTLLVSEWRDCNDRVSEVERLAVALPMQSDVTGAAQRESQPEPSTVLKRKLEWCRQLVEQQCLSAGEGTGAQAGVADEGGIVRNACLQAWELLSAKVPSYLLGERWKLAQQGDRRLFGIVEDSHPLLQVAAEHIQTVCQQGARPGVEAVAVYMRDAIRNFRRAVAERACDAIERLEAQVREAEEREEEERRREEEERKRREEEERRKREEEEEERRLREEEERRKKEEEERREREAAEKEKRRKAEEDRLLSIMKQEEEAAKLKAGKGDKSTENATRPPRKRGPPQLNFAAMGDALLTSTPSITLPPRADPPTTTAHEPPPDHLVTMDMTRQLVLREGPRSPSPSRPHPESNRNLIQEPQQIPRGAAQGTVQADSLQYSTNPSAATSSIRPATTPCTSSTPPNVTQDANRGAQPPGHSVGVPAAHPHRQPDAAAAAADERTSSKSVPAEVSEERERGKEAGTSAVSCNPSPSDSERRTAADSRPPSPPEKAHLPVSEPEGPIPSSAVEASAEDDTTSRAREEEGESAAAAVGVCCTSSETEAAVQGVHGASGDILPLSEHGQEIAVEKLRFVIHTDGPPAGSGRGQASYHEVTATNGIPSVTAVGGRPRGGRGDAGWTESDPKGRVVHSSNEWQEEDDGAFRVYLTDPERLRVMRGQESPDARARGGRGDHLLGLELGRTVGEFLRWQDNQEGGGVTDSASVSGTVTRLTGTGGWASRAQIKHVGRVAEGWVRERMEEIFFGRRVVWVNERAEQSLPFDLIVLPKGGHNSGLVPEGSNWGGDDLTELLKDLRDALTERHGRSESTRALPLDECLFVEVKGSVRPAQRKPFVEVSLQELRWADRLGDRYEIWRVTGLCRQEPEGEEGRSSEGQLEGEIERVRVKQACMTGKVHLLLCFPAATAAATGAAAVSSSSMG